MFNFLFIIKLQVFWKIFINKKTINELLMFRSLKYIYFKGLIGRISAMYRWIILQLLKN